MYIYTYIYIYIYIFSFFFTFFFGGGRGGGWRGKDLAHSDLDRFTRTKAQNWISLVSTGKNSPNSEERGSSLSNWERERVSRNRFLLVFLLLCLFLACFWVWGVFLSCRGPFCSRRRTNVQQLTCNIDLSRSFYYLFFSFVLIELKPFVLKGKVPGEKIMKKCENLWKVWKIMKRFCPLVVAL